MASVLKKGEAKVEGHRSRGRGVSSADGWKKSSPGRGHGHGHARPVRLRE